MKAKNHVQRLSTRDEEHLQLVIYSTTGPKFGALTHPYIVTTEDGANYAWCDCARQAALVFATDTKAHGLIATQLDFLHLMPRGTMKNPTRLTPDELQNTWRDIVAAHMHLHSAQRALSQWRVERVKAGIIKK